MTFKPPSGFQAHEVPTALAFYKLAQLPDPPPDSGEPPLPEENTLPEIRHPGLHALKTLGAGALGVGVGTAAGYGAQMGLERLLGLGVSKPALHKTLRVASPILGGLMGLAFHRHHQNTNQELHRALEAYKNQSAGAVSDK